MIDDPVRQAQAFYGAGNFGRCLELAEQGLQARPDDPALLRLAGRCNLELDRLDQAMGQLRKLVQLSPDDAEAWHDLGEAAIEQGALPEAVEAFRQVVRLQPDDTTNLVDLGHALYDLGHADEAIKLGHVDEAIELLTRAVTLEPGQLGTLRSLVEMHLRLDRLQEARELSRQILHLRPDDVLAQTDNADLSLALGHLGDAVPAYGALRHLPGHEVYAYHGLIQCAIQQQRWRRALDLAVDTTRLDRFDVTTQLLAYVVAQLFGEEERPAPAWDELEASLTAERAEHRRLCVDALIS